MQPAAQMISDAVMPDALETQGPQLDPSEPQKAAETVNETKLDAESAAKSEGTIPLVDETKAEGVTDAKDKSKETTPSQNAKALLRDKLLSSKTEEHAKAKASSDEKTIAVSDIDVRLAEYERRLAKAKQTATQMWH